MKSSEALAAANAGVRKAGQFLRPRLQYIRDRIREHAEVDPWQVLFDLLATQIERLKQRRFKHSALPPSTANPMPKTSKNETISN